MSKNTNTLPLPSARDYHFNTEFNNKTTSDLTQFILDANAEDEYLTGLYALSGQGYNPTQINIYIDSYGGEAFAMRGLLGVVERSKIHINTIAVGACMSCGFFLLIAGHSRYAYERAGIMYHTISSVTWGQIQDIEESTINLKRMQKDMEKYTRERTTLSKHTLKDIRKRKFDWYMTTDEALESGVIHEII